MFGGFYFGQAYYGSSPSVLGGFAPSLRLPTTAFLAPHSTEAGLVPLHTIALLSDSDHTATIEKYRTLVVLDYG